MGETELLEGLEDAARRLEIRIRRESFRGDGGLCRLHGETVIIMNRLRTPAEQIEILASSLAEVDLDGIFIQPRIREEIAGYQGGGQSEIDTRLAG